MHKYYPKQNVRPNKPPMTYQGDAFLADFLALPEKVADDDWSATIENKSGVSSLAVCNFDILRVVFNSKSNSVYFIKKPKKNKKVKKKRKRYLVFFFFFFFF